MQNWRVELAELDIRYLPWQVINAKALIIFFGQMHYQRSQAKSNNNYTLEENLNIKESDTWIICVNRSSYEIYSGVGVILKG